MHKASKLKKSVGVYTKMETFVHQNRDFCEMKGHSSVCFVRPFKAGGTQVSVDDGGCLRRSERWKTKSPVGVRAREKMLAYTVTIAVISLLISAYG